MTEPNRNKRGKSFSAELVLIVRRASQVWRLVPRKHKVAFLITAALMALTSACNTALPLVLGKLVDEIRLGTEKGLTQRELYWLASFYLSLIAAAYGVRETLQVVRRYLVENSCTRLEKTMTVKVISHLLKADLATLTQEKVGALQGRINRSVIGFVRFLRMGFLDFFPALVTGAFALAASLTKQPWLGLVMAGVIPLSLFLTIRQLISQKGIRLTLIRSREVMEGTVVEQLCGIDYVRAANTHHREVERVAKAAEKRRQKEIRHHFQMSLFGCGKALNEGFFHILVITFAIHMAIQGKVSFGDILTFSILFLNVMSPLSEVHRVIDEGHECSLQVGDLVAMLTEPKDISFCPAVHQEPKLADGAPLILVENLRVNYRTTDGKLAEALKGLNLSIRHGETIGVAGRSGCGKTTWLRVLLRLTHPSSGSVYLGKAPIDSVSREDLGRLMGYVGQSPFVFAGTIAENITYGSENVPLEKVVHAARMACIHDEIIAMPNGYDTVITERGVNLSGGQRQRLALARVFIKNPPILILDEGTSALDTISERSIQRAINTARSDRTVILVAHRLSTLRDTDRIFVFDDGKITETGSYSELLRRGGLFTELVRCAEEGNNPASKKKKRKKTALTVAS